MPCQAAKRSALFAIDRRGGRCDVFAGAGFHFDEAQDVTVPGDQVQVAWDLAGTPSSGYDDEAVAAQEEKRGFFAAFSGDEMFG
jgi:hypothetical protein